MVAAGKLLALRPRCLVSALGGRLASRGTADVQGARCERQVWIYMLKKSRIPEATTVSAVRQRI